MSRIKALEGLILKHKALYYQGRPEISDNEFDKLEDELKKLDPENVALSVVGSTTSASDKIKHDKKMLSLEKTYVLDDLLLWKGSEDILSTMKLDGISCSIIFENGKLSIAKTRGDGTFGENITAKVLWITNIPKLIKPKNKIEIRGELFCDEKSFFDLSNEMTSMGLEKPTSQRNIVAGLMGRKDNLEFCRYIKFMAFDYIGNERLKTEKEKFDILSNMGFLIPEVEVHKEKIFVRKLADQYFASTDGVKWNKLARQDSPAIMLNVDKVFKSTDLFLLLIRWPYTKSWEKPLTILAIKWLLSLQVNQKIQLSKKYFGQCREMEF